MPTKEPRNPQHSTGGADDPQLLSKEEVPSRNFFAALMSVEMEAIRVKAY
jgi:hypothetical protein